LVCEKNDFFAENWQKSQKIVIMTTTLLSREPLVRKSCVGRFHRHVSTISMVGR
jgi:hypothetical protein